VNKKEAISVMNNKGALKEPFLFVIDYLMDHCHVIDINDASAENILFHFRGKTNIAKVPKTEKTMEIFPKAIPFGVYLDAFQKVQKELNYGNSYLVNLTFQTPIITENKLLEIYHQASAKYKLYFKDLFTVFSPETFITINGNTISTFPMKGTIDANVPQALEKLLTNEKEMAEHATIVDLLRNDLSLFAQDVRVSDYRYTEVIKTTKGEILQVSSAITGTLPEGYQSEIGDILFSMLPAGSVTGAPKPKTIEIIENAEDYKRGYYTGIAGYFDGETLDSCVLIRFIENQNGNLVYKSGGGITALSNAEDEYNELITKIYVPTS
jgi:para-aminobenzoate synthetase component I